MSTADRSLALPDLAAIRAAHARIAPHVHRTPVLTCSSLDAAVGARLFFKCENFQRIGAFKARGAVNAVFALPQAQATRGVVTHSSGNHGAAIAYAAARRGVRACVVMPDSAPRIKQHNVRSLGATIEYCGPTGAAREARCRDVQLATGATLVHPFDDVDVIAGQGTAALELLDEIPDLDCIVAPIGGGGLLSGTAIASKGVRPDIRVVGTEPANADDAARGFRSGVVEPVASTTTIADGLRSPLAPRTLRAIRMHVEAVATASEASIVDAMRLVWERMKIIVEPSCAVPIAALLERTLALDGLRVGVILSGGNVDLDHLPWQKPV
ncbi:MAG TPA: pyridoxal-phosphate dependent enzyme [Casimicrobiaceae bacterium]|nr:pyridoxal-phosphate dependent enzyme [Casimicrobiaceae bacterium]